MIDRQWKPLVPPYDFLKFMEDEEHRIGAGRRGFVLHPDAAEGTDEKEEEKSEQDAEDSEKVDAAMKENQKHSSKHIEL